MSEIRKRKINKRRSLPGLLPVQPSQLAGPASRRPSPPPSSVVFVLDRGRGVWPARARATAPRHLLACLPALPSSSRCPGRRHALPPALSHSPAVLPSSPSLSLSRPNTTIAAVRHSSRHRPPLAPPLSSGAPPRPPLPPHQAKPLGKLCIASTPSSSSSGSDHHRRRFAVSSASPSPLRRPLQPR